VGALAPLPSLRKIENMKLDLAKQLQAAGFPLKQFNCKYPANDHEMGVCAACEPVHIFLEELIEACGTRFYTLRRDPWGEYDALGDTPRVHHGATADEAVALLWLSLK
jgi:hypothetical protein